MASLSDLACKEPAGCERTKASASSEKQRLSMFMQRTPDLHGNSKIRQVGLD